MPRGRCLPTRRLRARKARRLVRSIAPPESRGRPARSCALGLPRRRIGNPRRHPRRRNRRPRPRGVRDWPPNSPSSKPPRRPSRTGSPHGPSISHGSTRAAFRRGRSPPNASASPSRRFATSGAWRRPSGGRSASTPVTGTRPSSQRSARRASATRRRHRDTAHMFRRTRCPAAGHQRTRALRSRTESTRKDMRKMIEFQDGMLRNARAWVAATFAGMILAASACEGDLGTAGDDGTGGETGSATAGGGGSELPCSDADPCPSGQFCWNGLCALGCTSNDDCAEDQYCDTMYTHLCHNREVPECEIDEDCAAGQVCVSGFCSTPPPETACDPNGVLVGDDGCSSQALCIEDVDTEAAKCYTFPACRPDDTCPVGTQGAVCNVDLVPNKDRICLVGMCTGEAHCPAEWSCAVPEGGVLGLCTPGTPGSPCTQNDHCGSGVCQLPLPGSVGFCA
ncbi:MAG: hypothetical protein D6705_00575 [Deltaproteobacteria bacterium]|nr:MAG: hypothetical protein D6705_00575 [Deltaproteobacteria bacterium]